MITSFGGRVTSSISGKTNVLVVGKNPGASKVMKGRSREKCKLISLHELKDTLEGTISLEDLGKVPLFFEIIKKRKPNKNYFFWLFYIIKRIWPTNVN